MPPHTTSLVRRTGHATRSSDTSRAPSRRWSFRSHYLLMACSVSVEMRLGLRGRALLGQMATASLQDGDSCGFGTGTLWFSVTKGRSFHRSQHSCKTPSVCVSLIRIPTVTVGGGGQRRLLGPFRTRITPDTCDSARPRPARARAGSAHGGAPAPQVLRSHTLSAPGASHTG